MEIDRGRVLSYDYTWTSPQYCMSEQHFGIANQKTVFTIYLNFHVSAGWLSEPWLGNTVVICVTHQ